MKQPPLALRQARHSHIVFEIGQNLQALLLLLTRVHLHVCACCSDSIANAMTLCPRTLFVPEAHRDAAHVDAPIRVSEHGFNISAPHIHASALEKLQLRPGHRCDAQSFGPFS